ncbi:DNA polymerase ligase N-terminal domain-containing protein [Glycomyces terrestris]|uniref:DNA ligase n=1 Tax=Glycomyces terrestris TaxID=2493553 RepID=A0A426V425_9ACTN|nr:DNA polymerase ligase N-terminal domain-containing protein [Glycomyces terrestris]RRS01581.1 DNA ligase [Glycomyces terrestris]
MARGDKLGEYRAKRDLRKSGEPGGGRRRGKADRFVVQRHEATRLHFDFRLEVDGVLVSWAVPKGPSLNPDDRRLAVRTEDHPLDYAEFEGLIPEPEYGAGTVIVWDAGTYRNLTAKRGKAIAMADAVEHGHVKVYLEGERLTGAFALSRMGDGDWILVKVDDEGADRRRKPAKTRLESVLTGRTNRDLRA